MNIHRTIATFIRVALLIALTTTPSSARAFEPAVQVSSSFPLQFDTEFAVSPDGRWIVYLANVNGVNQLFSVRTDGTDGVRLDSTPTGGSASGVDDNFEITADSRYVIYSAEQNEDRFELFRSRIAGGGNVRLSQELSGADNVGVRIFAVSPDGSQVYYAQQQSLPSTELFYVSAAGGTSVRQSNRAGGGSTVVNVSEIKVDPTNNVVVFEAAGAIYSVPVTGTESLQLSMTDNIDEFWLAPDGATALYSTRLNPSPAPNRRDLFAVPTAGGSATQLTPAGMDFARPRNVQFPPDSSSVVFRGSHGTTGSREVFAGGLSETAQRISAPPRAGEDLDLVVLSPDGSRVVYVSDHDRNAQNEAYSVLRTGGGFVKVSPVFADPSSDVPTVQNAVQFSRNSQQVIIEADDEATGGISLYRNSASGGASTKISTGDVDLTSWEITPNDLVVYLSDTADSGANELFAVSINSSGSTLLSAPLAANETVAGVRLNAAGTHAAYALVNESGSPDTFTIWSVPLALAVEVLDATAVETDGVVDVTFRLSDPAQTDFVTVFYQTEDGTALAGADYTATSGSISFTGQQLEQKVSIAVTDDTMVEDGEAFSVVITVVTGGVATRSRATVSLVDQRPGGDAFLLASAVLPGSRTVQVGNTATVFATVINVGDQVGPDCSIAPITSAPMGFEFQTTNPTTNALTGSPNTPVDIPAGGLGTFILSFAPTAAFTPTTIELNYSCADLRRAEVQRGINTLTLGASDIPVPDVIALTTSVDVRLLEGRTDLFAVASFNLGSPASLTAVLDTGDVQLPLTTLVCATDSATGACSGPAGETATTQFDTNGAPTFAIFATPTAAIPFNPAANRLFVRFIDAAGVERGSTSTAISTE